MIDARTPQAASATSTCGTASATTRTRAATSSRAAWRSPATASGLRHALPLLHANPGGQQADDTGRAGRRLPAQHQDRSRSGIGGYGRPSGSRSAPRSPASRSTRTGDGDPRPTRRRSRTSCRASSSAATRPTCRTSPPRPTGPLRFNVDTQAFVNVHRRRQRRHARPTRARRKFLNLHLGAREPEPGKKKLFFANAWAIAFTTRAARAAYVVSAGSDLLVKVNVAGNGKLSFTVDAEHDRYIDLNDPANPAHERRRTPARTRRASSSTRPGTRAYVTNFVSRNVSRRRPAATTSVIKTIRTAPLPAPGSPEEVDRGRRGDVLLLARQLQPAGGHAVSTDERLSQRGLAELRELPLQGPDRRRRLGVRRRPAQVGAAERDLQPAATAAEQRILNYSAIFDEVEDFELNIRNVSGPGPLAAAHRRAAQPAAGDEHARPQPRPAHRRQRQHQPARPASSTRLAEREREPPAGHGHAARQHDRGAGARPRCASGCASRSARRTRPLTKPRVESGAARDDDQPGPRRCSPRPGCASCHGGSNWTISTEGLHVAAGRGRRSSPSAPPPPVFGNPVGSQYLNRFLRDIGSFNLGVPGGGNPIGANIGGDREGDAPRSTQRRRPAAAGRARHRLQRRRQGQRLQRPVAARHQRRCRPTTTTAPARRSPAWSATSSHRTANGTRPDVLANPADQARGRGVPRVDRREDTGGRAVALARASGGRP